MVNDTAKQLYTVLRPMFNSIPRLKVWVIVKETPKLYKVHALGYQYDRRQIRKDETGVFTNGKEAARYFLEVGNKFIQDKQAEISKMQHHLDEMAEALERAEDT